jgi:predicted RNA-binding Zn ribbon-like protein
MVRESSELTLRWDDGAVFSFDAGAVCLELLTTGGMGDYRGYETLRSATDLAAWLAECRLRVDDAKVRDDDVPAARQLRSAVYTAAVATMAGRPLPRPSVGMINELAAGPPPVPVLSGEVWRWAIATTGAQALSAIARDAIDLFSGDYADRIRECAAGDCQLIFVDLSRPGRRRWCSMERCGNRAKQRARRVSRGQISRGQISRGQSIG